MIDDDDISEDDDDDHEVTVCKWNAPFFCFVAITSCRLGLYSYMFLF